MFLPHSWQLFIPSPDQNSPSWASLSYLLRFQPFWWFESSVNMLLAFFCLLRRLHAEFSCFCCLQRLVVQQQEQPGLYPTLPLLAALLLSTPFSLLHKLLKANSYHPEPTPLRHGWKLPQSDAASVQINSQDFVEEICFSVKKSD